MVRRILCASGAAAVALCVPVTEAQDASAEPDLAAQWMGQGNPVQTPYSIRSISAVGNGCPLFGWTAALSRDGSTFGLKFADFAPTINPAQKKSTANCRLAIAVNVPIGYSFRVEQFSYRGYVYLEDGISAKLTTTYAFSNDMSKAETLHTTMAGPMDTTFEVDDTTSRTGIWSPCNRSTTQVLNVFLQADLQNGSPAADGTLEINEAYGISLKWGVCQGFTGSWNPTGNWNPNGSWNPNGGRASNGSRGGGPGRR
jgi:hypothetical protein